MAVIDPVTVSVVRHGLHAIVDEMKTEGRGRLAATRCDGPVGVRRSADMRYGEQTFEIPVELDTVDGSRSDLVQQMADAFHARHEDLRTHALRNQDAFLVNARSAVIGALPVVPTDPPRETAAPARPRSQHRACLGGWHESPVFSFDDVAVGQIVTGPAIVEASTTTVLLRRGARAEVTPLGWVDVAVGERPGTGDLP